MGAVLKKKKVAFWSVVAAVFITCFKLIVGLATGSLGLLSEALHSGLDLVAAIITYFSVSISDKPADFDHNYGHGKVENLSAFIETLLLLVTCGWIIYEAVERLVGEHRPIEVNVWSYAAVILSIVVDVSRSRALSKAAKAHNSQALEADALHFSTDIWSSAVVLLGLICAQFGFFFADTIAALFVAAIVIVVSFRLAKRSVNQLLDGSPLEVVREVESYLKSSDDVKAYRNLKVRQGGADVFIEVSLFFDGDMPLKEAHALCDKVERELGDRIPRSTVYIHPEPLGDPLSVEKAKE